MKNLVLENRKNTRGLTKEHFTNEITFASWKNAIKELRLKVSGYAVLNRTNASEESIKESITAVFTAYNKVLSFFTNKSLDEKVKAQSTDLNSLLTIIGTSRKEKDNDNGKQFLPVGANVFRKSVEDFIADRITGETNKTAAEIELERKAKNQAKKDAKKQREKAKKDAEKAVSETEPATPEEKNVPKTETAPEEENKTKEETPTTTPKEKLVVEEKSDDTSKKPTKAKTAKQTSTKK